MQSEVKVIRSDQADKLNEQRFRGVMAKEGLQPYRWSNRPHDVYGAHSHPYDKVIYVIQGSIIFGLPQTDEQVQLNAGDRLDLPRGVIHNATVGPEGVVCLEAHI
ncbi:MAG: hypothetical protein R3293_01535 [Candidatus Promineifilaceae bacterium]|nr:hypothetical protein [Candidatus Promineifilaceae bacterium]